MTDLSPAPCTQHATSPPPRYALYDRFAAIYNQHFGQFARRVVPALDRLVLSHLPKHARVLDLCCGTGQLAAALSARGFAVTGVDGSAAMLAFARQNAPAAEFVLDDVRTFDIADTFAAVVSTFDSINHIIERADLDRTFANVHRALRPGGLFVFDLNMEEGYHCRWWGSWHTSNEGDDFLVEAVYCPRTRLGQNVVTCTPSGTQAPTRLSFVERCYSEETVRESLAAAGFDEIHAHDGHRDLGMFGEIGRSFFVCRKSEVRSPCGAAVTRARPRTPEECVRDGVWPPETVRRELGAASRRLRAIEEVLCTLPAQPYERLRQSAGRFDWFVPGELVMGQVHPFRAVVEPAATGDAAPTARVVYLSPLLEQQDWPVVVTVVAHELAHVILAHKLSDLDADTYRQQEGSVRDVVGAWGFRCEVDETAATLGRRMLQEP